MKRVFTLVPFISLGVSVVWLSLISAIPTWLPFVTLGSFVGSLFLIPLISRKSILNGYIAVTYLLLIIVFSLSVSSYAPVDGGKAEIAEIFVKSSIKVPLQCYFLNVGRYPSTEEGLDALVTCPNGLGSRWKGPYVDTVANQFALDPWNHRYQYRCPGTHNIDGYDIWSLGPDGIPSKDDIGNWNK